MQHVLARTSTLIYLGHRPPQSGETASPAPAVSQSLGAPPATEKHQRQGGGDVRLRQARGRVARYDDPTDVLQNDGQIG